MARGEGASRWNRACRKAGEGSARARTVGQGALRGLVATASGRARATSRPACVRARAREALRGAERRRATREGEPPRGQTVTSGGRAGGGERLDDGRARSKAGLGEADAWARAPRGSPDRGFGSVDDAQTGGGGWIWCTASHEADVGRWVRTPLRRFADSSPRRSRVRCCMRLASASPPGGVAFGAAEIDDTPAVTWSAPFGRGCPRCESTGASRELCRRACC